MQLMIIQKSTILENLQEHNYNKSTMNNRTG